MEGNLFCTRGVLTRGGTSEGTMVYKKNKLLLIKGNMLFKQKSCFEKEVSVNGATIVTQRSNYRLSEEEMFNSTSVEQLFNRTFSSTFILE